MESEYYTDKELSKDEQKKKIRDKLPYRVWKKYLDRHKHRFYDTREYFKTFKNRYVTKDDIKSICLKENINIDDILPYQLLIYYMLSVSGFDWMYTKVEDEINDIACELSFFQKDSEEVKCKRYISLNHYDLIFDIKVFGATFCVLWYGDGNPFEKDCGMTLEYRGNRCGFEMVDIRDENNSIIHHTFPDITLSSPLLKSCGRSIRLYTDGNKIQYFGGLMNNEMFDSLVIDGNLYTINEIQNHILLNGHMWISSYAFPVNELVDISSEMREKDEFKKF